MKIYAIAGFPGTGKTTLRMTRSDLMYLDHLDVADYYRMNPGEHSNDVFAYLLFDMDEILMAGRDVVVEATFFKDSVQRTWLEGHAALFNAEVEYIEMTAPTEVCLERIRQQYREEVKNANRADLEQINEYYRGRFRLLRDFGDFSIDVAGELIKT